jgi:hypothetical protein
MLPTSFVIQRALPHYDFAAGTFSDTTFEKASDDSTRVVYYDTSRPLGLSQLITVSHNVAKPGLTGVDRRTIKLIDVVAAENGETVHNSNFTLSFFIPRTSAMGIGYMQEKLGLLMSILHPGSGFTAPADGHNLQFVTALERCTY